MPVKKRTRRKAQKLDEDTIMALALSRSLLEQEMEKKREMVEEREILAQLSSPPATAAPVLQWRPGAGKLTFCSVKAVKLYIITHSISFMFSFR